MRRSLIITVVIALLCLCGCEAAVTVPESPEPTKASEIFAFFVWILKIKIYMDYFNNFNYL